MSDGPMDKAEDTTDKRSVSPAGDDPRRRLAAALRPVITMTVASELADEAMLEAAEAIEEAGRRLAGQAGPKRARQQPNIAKAAQEFFPTSPIMGMVNPIAPPVRVKVVDGTGGGPREIRAEAYFDYAYEGPPTCVHGGVIAETFDEVLGAANLASGHPGMTGGLTVRYRKPTPLRTDLRIEARFLRKEGRKIFSWAGLYHGDLLTAEADGLFVEVAPAQFLAIAEGNVDSADPAMLEAIRAEAARVGAASDVHPGPR